MFHGGQFMALVTKQDWLNAGRAVILKDGFKGLTLQVLLERLGVTHGSFYHHFKNRKALTEALLEEWQQEMAVNIIESTKQIADLNARVDTLIQIGIEQSEQTQLEVAIRAQAFSDPVVENYVKQVDLLRLEHSRALALAATGDPERAEILGNMIHAIFVGSQQIYPPFGDEQITSIYRELKRLISASLTVEEAAGAE